MKVFKFIIILGFSLMFGLVFAQSTQTQVHDDVVIKRDADVPELPFIDNPNPLLCGIPEVWKENKTTWITGIYQEELIQEEVLLYDSHFRKSITGRIESGLKVKILLLQVNPSLNYYLVQSIGLEPIQEGWVPAPFVSFEKP